MSWIVYVLECSDGTLYTGITNDLKSRIIAHQTEKVQNTLEAVARLQFFIKKSAQVVA